MCLQSSLKWRCQAAPMFVEPPVRILESFLRSTLPRFSQSTRERIVVCMRLQCLGRVVGILADQRLRILEALKKVDVRLRGFCLHIPQTAGNPLPAEPHCWSSPMKWRVSEEHNQRISTECRRRKYGNASRRPRTLTGTFLSMHSEQKVNFQIWTQTS